MKFYSLLLITLCSCGAPTRQLGTFESIVAAFEADAARLGKPAYINDLTIQFGTLSAQVLAQCDLNPFAHPTIIVNPNTWEAMSPIDQELVIRHEIGHCIYKKGHDDEALHQPGGRAYLSIMRAHPLSLYDYADFRDAYTLELMNPTSGTPLL